jgi:hypothetical protein
MGLNEVFKKVSAINEVTELASEKVELASLPRLISLADAALKFRDKTKVSTDKAKQAIVDLNNILGQSINNYNKVVAEADELENAAKDLGIALPNEIKASRDSAKTEISLQTELRKKVSSIKL